ncbi:hypothetical protein ALC60_00176 [Trachymyrmex zeteki]|uniref:Uncharacterized protein n=1 Tax=Mycetomoellerius zeteki TaxID=64791 RepID=A0A151XKL1_9HYME|nr:hypothetical protein ALC60_00176 [Trachymyrmex zeteki]
MRKKKHFKIREQLKKFLKSHRNSARFAEFQPSYFLDGLKKLEHRWTKYIELKGDYIEK